MERSKYKINIIGAGLSGLVAAKVLEDHGYAPVIFESTNKVGGRIKTDILQGYQLDHGFQVLIEAYPKAKQYLNYESLELQKIKPGAVIFYEGKNVTIGDPLRDRSLLFPTLFSGIGDISDKLKIFQLNQNLQKKSLPEIFASEEITTLNYLQKKGFSEEMIVRFFKPFFSGIFLEPELSTSSRMFEFVYKMFGEGLAVIPKKGMGAIPEQLAAKLNTTTFRFNSPVKQVLDGQIILESGEKIESHFTIIASEPSKLVNNLKGQEVKWKSCHNFYFETENRLIEPALIGLVTDAESLVNNIFFYNSLETNSQGGKQLLSATVVKETPLSGFELLMKVEEDLSKYCGIQNLQFLKHFHIKNALPNLKPVYYEIDPTETQLTSSIFLAGDQLLNGSQNAALIYGERAALGVIKTLEGGTITGELTSEYR
jgi:phytoene dehydrogenase-like protein